MPAFLGICCLSLSGGIGISDVSPGVLAHVLGAAASSGWVDPVEQLVPLCSAPPLALAPGPPCFLAPSVLISCLAFLGLLCIPREKLLPSQKDGVAPEKREEGREKSIGAKCRGHVPCRGCGMECLEGSGTFCSLCCSRAGRGVWSLWIGCGELLLRQGLRCWCRVVMICFASWKQLQGNVGMCCPRAPDGLSCLVPSKAVLLSGRKVLVNLGSWCPSPQVFPGPVLPLLWAARGRCWPSSPLPPLHGTALGSAICMAAPSWCLNRSQGWWRQIKVFLCAVQNR